MQPHTPKRQTPLTQHAKSTAPQAPAAHPARRLAQYMSVLFAVLFGAQSLYASNRLELKQALENPSQVNAKNFPFREFYTLAITPMLALAGDRLTITGNKCKGEDDNLSCKTKSIAFLGMDLAHDVRYTIATKDEHAQAKLESKLTPPCDEIFRNLAAQAREIHQDTKKHQAWQNRANLACSLLPDSIMLTQNSTKKQKNDYMESALETKLRAPNDTKLTIEITGIDRAKDFAGHNIPAIYAMIYSATMYDALQNTLESLGSSNHIQTPKSMTKLLDHTSTITRLKVLLESKTLGDDIYTLAESKKSKQEFYKLHGLEQAKIPEALAKLMEAMQQFMLGKSERVGILFEAGDKGGIPDGAFASLSRYLETLDLARAMEEISRYGKLTIISR